MGDRRQPPIGPGAAVALALAVAAIIVLAFAVASAALGAPVGVLATNASDGPIAAYDNTVAWTAWDDAAGGFTIVVWRDGQTRTLPVAPAPAPLPVSAGPGPGGSTWLVWSRCDADERVRPVTDCDIEAYNLNADRAEPVPFAARSTVMERAPSIWRNRLVYATGRNLDLARVHVTDLDGRRDTVVPAIPASVCALSIVDECSTVIRATVQSTALSGDDLAVASRVSTSGGDIGICGLATVGVFDLETRALRRIDSATCGLGGQRFDGLGFDAVGRLWWRLGCEGDTGGCDGTSSGPFRLTTGAGVERLRPALGARVAGIAVAGRSPVRSVLAAGSPPACWTGTAPLTAYRCATVTARTPGDAADALAAVSGTDDDFPPSGYVTVDGTATPRVLQPPDVLSCTRGSALRPRPGAELWAGTSWYRHGQPSAGPAVTVTARSGDREVTGEVARETNARPVQHTTTLDLGTPAQACGRRWTLTYALPDGREVRFRTEVRPAPRRAGA